MQERKGHNHRLNSFTVDDREGTGYNNSTSHATFIASLFNFVKQLFNYYSSFPILIGSPILLLHSSNLVNYHH